MILLIKLIRTAALLLSNMVKFEFLGCFALFTKKKKKKLCDIVDFFPLLLLAYLFILFYSNVNCTAS